MYSSGEQYVCGLYFIQGPSLKTYLPRVSLSVHSRIIGVTSRSVLTQTFVNPKDKAIPELRYQFPLYDGVSVVGFVCTINKDRVIKGIVQERAQARKTFDDAVARGETAGLLEQLPKASDVFTTTIGNIPAGAEIKVEVTYLGELKHDAETDGIRFTIPTAIAPRYGGWVGGYNTEVLTGSNVRSQSGIEIVVDAEMPNGSNIKSVQSPTHPIAVSIGRTSISTDADDMSLQKASATLSLGSAELDKDFVVHVVATNTSNPVAVLETHPTIPNQRALMATLVPKFNLPAARPEIVFVCDRSGSMTSNISNLKAALHIFLKSLPLGVKFNICSFGSRHEFLFKGGSRSYDASSLEEATRYVDTFSANFGGTEMYRPVEDTFKKRYKDMNLEVFLLTDGEIWDQDNLFRLINDHVSESKGNVRLFTLGIGNGVSHALIEGVARAGNGFAQTVGDNEKMNAKVLRMLKASLTPHVKDYTLEVKYGSESPSPSTDDDDFELVEKVMDSLSIEVAEEPPRYSPAPEPTKPISLFDTSADPDVDMVDASLDQTAGGKYSHVPPVAEPKILQAPFNIPPLYPFNRTSVYLLLSAQSAQRGIKSVVLRGTSSHGPLELEIPVTVLPQKGETIHQLAARKAVKELEEGRGWIYHAKDAKDNGKLLKDKFEGRFADMVEREAVRLGVAFQVGGKWCSFVAVEEQQADHTQAAPRPQQTSQTLGDAQIQQQLLAQQQAQQRLRRGNFPAQPQVMFAQQQAQPQAQAQAQQQVATSFGQQARLRSVGSPFPTGAVAFGQAAPSSSGGLFGNSRSSPAPSSGGLFGASPSYALSAPRASAFVAVDSSSGSPFGSKPAALSAVPPPPPAPSGPPKPMARRALSERSSKESSPIFHDFSMDFAAPLPDDDYDDEDECMAFGLFDDGGYTVPTLSGISANAPAYKPAVSEAKKKSKKCADKEKYNAANNLVSSPEPESFPSLKKKKAAPGGGGFGFASAFGVDTRDTFEKLVALQSFAGSWAWSGGLLDVLGLKSGELDGKLAALQAQDKKGTDQLATALVLAFLELKLADRKDEWELLADKAVDWLDNEISGDAREFVQRVKGVF